MQRGLAVLLLFSLILSCAAGCASEQKNPQQTNGTTKEDSETMANEPGRKPMYADFKNPIADRAADPYVTQLEGRYYYCYAVGGGVAVKAMDRITDIEKDGVTVWKAPEGTPYSKEIWAPELHFIDGAWYIYLAADDGDNVNHRMYVLKREDKNPVGPFTFVGKITDPTDKWAIDGTVMQLGGELYFLWSGWEGDTNVSQNIYIAHMSDPWTIDGERVRLSHPMYDWEQKGRPHVNEGPAVLQHDGKTFIVYSASGSWTDDYCLGMLTLVGEDPLSPSSWKKSSTPVFRKNGTAYGPGHCSFTEAIDGSVMMFYHANLTSGTGWSGRSGWIQPIQWDEDGIPVFGAPSEKVSIPYRWSDE